MDRLSMLERIADGRTDLVLDYVSLVTPPIQQIRMAQGWSELDAHLLGRPHSEWTDHRSV